MGKVIPTEKPGKGDLVKGHRVWVFSADDAPAIPGKVVEVSPSGHRVKIDFGAFAAFGLSKRDFTWRRSVGAYQDCKDRTREGYGVALDRRPAHAG